jgi:hypothetical protein
MWILILSPFLVVPQLGGYVNLSSLDSVFIRSLIGGKTHTSHLCLLVSIQTYIPITTVVPEQDFSLEGFTNWYACLSLPFPLRPSLVCGHLESFR